MILICRIGAKHGAWRNVLIIPIIADALVAAVDIMRGILIGDNGWRSKINAALENNSG